MGSIPLCLQKGINCLRLHSSLTRCRSLTNRFPGIDRGFRSHRTRCAIDSLTKKIARHGFELGSDKTEGACQRDKQQDHTMATIRLEAIH